MLIPLQHQTAISARAKEIQQQESSSPCWGKICLVKTAYSKPPAIITSTERRWSTQTKGRDAAASPSVTCSEHIVKYVPFHSWLWSRRLRLKLHWTLQRSLQLQYSSHYANFGLYIMCSCICMWALHAADNSFRSTSQRQRQKLQVLGKVVNQMGRLQFLNAWLTDWDFKLF
jgi:hypothetical protein